MVILKLQLGEEIRRLGEAPASLQAIKEKVFKLFGIQNSRFEYKDIDGDDVQFDTQEEYDEALSSHTDPFKLKVIDSRNQFLPSCSVLKNEIGLEIRVCDSFADSLIDHDNDLLGKVEDNENLESAAQNALQIEFEDKATQTLIELISQETQATLEYADLQTECFTSFNDLTYEMITNASHRLKTKDLGAICSLCKSQIFETIFRCSKCPDYFTCHSCQAIDYHPHLLVKSNKAILKQSSNELSSSIEIKATETKPNLRPSFNMDNLLSQLVGMGFKDKQKNISALIKANYNLAEAINYLT